MSLFAKAWTVPAMIGVLLIARAAWHIFVSDLNLLEDEAHYWEWSRRIDWSYYSKGPGVAWSIWASTRIFGGSEWAIRLPAIVSTAIGMLGAAKAAQWAFPKRPELRAASALLYALVPGFAISSMIMTIDAPYVACWMWAGAFAFRAIQTGSIKVWAAFGITIAIGFLFKYTILLLLPGVILAALLTRSRRRDIRPMGLATAGLLASMGLVPVLIWNAGRDWPTVRHLLGHLGMRGGDVATTNGHWSALWLPEFLVVQGFVSGPVILLAAFGWLRVRNNNHDVTRTAFQILGSLAVPIYVFYFAVSLKTQTEGNWAMAGAATLSPLAALTVLDGVQRTKHTIRFLWGASIVGGTICILMFPGMRFVSERRVIGPLVPLYRFTGMHEHAAAASTQLEQIQSSTGLRPFVLSSHYGRASQLAYYLPGQPTVYCASPMLGGRKTQYDLWSDTALSDPKVIQELLGRPALLFGGTAEQWSTGFDTVRDIGPLLGEPKPDQRSTFIAAGFNGFPRHHNDASAGGE